MSYRVTHLSTSRSVRGRPVGRESHRDPPASARSARYVLTRLFARLRDIVELLSDDTSCVAHLEEERRPPTH